MPPEEIEIRLIGFAASSGFEIFLKTILDQLMLEAPSDSSITASFIKTEGLTSGEVLISSSQGQFSAHIRGRNSREVVIRIVQSIREQLGRWKKVRKKNIDSDLKHSLLSELLKANSDKQ